MSDFWNKRILLFVSIVFFFVYLFLYIWPTPLAMPPTVFEGRTEPAFLVLNQPDEAANYFFIRRLVLNSEFGYLEPLAELTDNQVHPRSMTVVRGSLAPIGFPGMILIYGVIVKIIIFFTGVRWLNIVVVSITPLIAAITPLLFYPFLKKIFSERISFFSALALYILPPWWYYASRPFQNNTIFCLALIFFLYACVRNIDAEKENQQNKFWSFVLGLSWVLPVYFRGSELGLLAILGGGIILTQCKKWDKKSLLSFSGGLIAGATIYFFTQYLYYGNILGTGYARPELDGDAGTILSIKSTIPGLGNLLLPFGFHPVAILKNFYHYIFILFYPWPLLYFGGFLFVTFLSVFSAKNSSGKASAAGHFAELAVDAPRIRAYIASLIFGLSYLLIFYGSWNFADNLAGAVSIGSSQTRYFLPIFVFALPLAVIFVHEIWRLGRGGKIIAFLLVGALSIASARMVYRPFEGLMAVKSHVADYYGWRTEIINRTEPEAIIVTRYADKYLFPTRKVIAGLGSDVERRAVLNLLKSGLPVYWYDLKIDEKDHGDAGLALNSAGMELSEPIAEWNGLQLRKILLTL
ncbi:MAG: hypothetical protein AAB390_01895 [Patescibacteria group bacterium]